MEENQMSMFDEPEQTQHDGKFYNTTRLTGDALEKSKEKAKTQSEIILGIYKKHRWLSPSTAQHIAKDMGHLWPITSVRRAITDLTSAGKLIKTGRRVEGNYGALEFVWEVLP